MGWIIRGADRETQPVSVSCWLLALVAILAIIASVLAGLDWRRNHAGDRLHLSDEQRPGRVWALNEAQAAWDRMRGEGGSRLRTTVIPNLFVYLEAGDRRAAYVDPQMGWMLTSNGTLIPFWQPRPVILDRKPLSAVERAPVLSSVFDALVSHGVAKAVGNGDPSSAQTGPARRVLVMGLDSPPSAALSKQLAARRETYLLLPGLAGSLATPLADVAAKSVVCAADPAAAWSRAAAAARPGQVPVFAVVPGAGQGAGKGGCDRSRDLLDIARLWVAELKYAALPMEIRRDGSFVEL